MNPFSARALPASPSRTSSNCGLGRRVAPTTRFVRRVLLFPLLLGPVGAQVQWTPQIDFAPRSAHAMAFDSQRQRTVLFGGGNGRADLWEFDGANWSLRQ